MELEEEIKSVERRLIELKEQAKNKFNPEDYKRELEQNLLSHIHSFFKSEDVVIGKPVPTVYKESNKLMRTSERKIEDRSKILQAMEGKDWLVTSEINRLVGRECFGDMKVLLKTNHVRCLWFPIDSLEAKPYLSRITNVGRSTMMRTNRPLYIWKKT